MSKLSDPVTFRKRVAGASLIGFPFAGVISSLIDAEEGTDTPPGELYAIATAHDGAILAAALVFMVSAVLTLPALGGILHLLRDRGVGLGHVGAALVLLGAFGHMGYATWQVMLSQAPQAGDEAAMIAFLDRASLTTDILLPLLVAVAVGYLLLGFALRRAGIVPLWVPLVLVGGVLFATVTDSVDSKFVPVVNWSFVLATFGFVGVRILGMSDDEWARRSPASETQVAPVADAMPAH